MKTGWRRGGLVNRVVLQGFLVALLMVVGGSAAAGDAQLSVSFFDVGQGAATLLQGPDFAILVDAGRHDRSDVVPHLLAADVQSIDLFIGTHPHSDHIGQCAAVLQQFSVREVWMSGDLHTTRTFERCLDAILASDAAYYEPRAGEAFQIGSARLEIVHPKEVSGDFNNGSIGVRILYGNVVFLFTGDAESDAEAEMISRGHQLQAHILHLGHHGSRTSSTPPFLEAVEPEVAIYSAGADNSYGHPHQDVLQRVGEWGAAIYGTDVNGTIRVTTDGSTYAVFPEKVETLVVEPGGSVDGCREGQIDLNTATVTELTMLVHVGPVLAERIVEGRPFFTVDDLMRVVGIGASRLAAIHDQGVACVSARTAGGASG